MKHEMLKKYESMLEENINYYANVSARLKEALSHDGTQIETITYLQKEIHASKAERGLLTTILADIEVNWGKL